jgi:signal transduction histidine kinase
VNLADWCRTWLDGWQEHPRAAEIIFRPDAEPISVHTYPSLLRQVLDNLLDNACKYSEPGTPVVVTLAIADGHATLSVMDQGCGIDEADRERVFEPFFRSSHTRWLGKQGVGLGLTVARRLVTILAARLDVTSEAGKGSQFRISLPLDVSLEPAQQSGWISEDRESERDESRSMKMENNPGVNKPHTDLADSTTSIARPSASAVVNVGGLE